jgi:hypothetical protein
MNDDVVRKLHRLIASEARLPHDAVIRDRSGNRLRKARLEFPFVKDGRGRWIAGADGFDAVHLPCAVDFQVIANLHRAIGEVGVRDFYVLGVSRIGRIGSEVSAFPVLRLFDGLGLTDEYRGRWVFLLKIEPDPARRLFVLRPLPSVVQPSLNR